jgi:hypothetical protein
MSRAFDMALESLTLEQAAHIRTLRAELGRLMDTGCTPADIEEHLQIIDELEVMHAVHRGILLAVQEIEAAQ